MASTVETTSTRTGHTTARRATPNPPGLPPPLTGEALAVRPCNNPPPLGIMAASRPTQDQWRKRADRRQFLTRKNAYDGWDKMKTPGQKKHILDSQVLRNILTMFTGSGLAQLITLISTPIISRLFNPDDFGIAALLLSIAGISAPLATLSYSTAIQLPERASDAQRLLRATILIAFAFSTLMAAAVFLSSHAFNAAIFSQFRGWEWTLPLLVLLYGIEAALESLLTRMKKFKRQATSNVLGSAVASGSRIFLGLLSGSSIGGLVIGYLLARASRIVMLASGGRQLFATPTTSPAPASYKSLLLNYRDFPLFATPTTLLHAANKNLPLLLFGILFSPAVAGFYAMSNRLFFRPFQLMQFSFRRVYTQHLISAVHQKRKIVPMLLKACSLTAPALAIPSLLLYVYGEPAVTFFLGEKWRAAGTFIEISAPLLLFASLAIPANAAMVALRQQRRLLVFEIATTVMVAIGFLGSFLVWREPIATLYAIVLVLSVRHLSLLAVAFSISLRHDASTSKMD